MSLIQNHFHRLIWKTESRIDILKHRFRDTMGLDGDWHILMYHGYLCRQNVRVEGRVMQDRNIAVGKNDSYLTNLLNSYKRLGSREAPHAELELRVFDRSLQVRADEEGFFTIDVPHQEKNLPVRTAVSARLLSHEPYDREFVGMIFGHSEESGLGIISDVDDTILLTGATSIRQMARWTFLHNAYSRRRIAGVGAWYRALQQGCEGNLVNPFFYVSSSPWNLFDLIDHFILLNNIPSGPLLLRDYGIDEGKLVIESHSKHKSTRCEALLASYPHLRFLLIGDAGQEDTYIYRSLLEKHPDRIQAVFIRSVGSTRQDTAIRREIDAATGRGLPMFFIEDSAEGADICRELGMINAAQVSSIKEAVKAHQT